MPAPLTGWRREGRTLVELFALCGFAIAQPLLDLFGRAPHQFAFRGATAADIVLFGLALVLVPPVVLWLVELPFTLGGAWLRSLVHSVVIGVLVWAFAVQILRPLADGFLLMLLAAAVGAGAAYAHRRFAPVRLWLSFAALGPVAFLLMFLVASPTARLISGDRVAALAPDIESPVPIVLVVFDELPLASLVDGDGEIDAELFPNIAELASDSHWFRNTTSPSTFTWHAVPSILTGRLPEHDTAPFAVDHPENLFTLLGSSYEMDVTESVTRLCPTSLCEEGTQVGGRSDLVRDAVDIMQARLSWSGPSGDLTAGFVEPALDIPEEDPQPDQTVGVTTRFQQLLDGIEDDSIALHFLHVLLPHQPLRYLPSGRTYEHPDPDLGHDGDDWTDQPWPARLGRQRHLLQVQYVDRLIGQLLDDLHDSDVYDDALVVLTADHGIAFDPGGPTRLVEEQPLTDEAAPDLLWVPLLVKLPAEDEPVVDDRNALTIDVLPTIADVLGLELPDGVEGRSLLGEPRDETTKPFFPSYVHEFGIGVRDPIEVEGETGFESMLDSSVDTLLPRGDADRIWRIGPSPELVGEPAGDLPPAAAELLGDPEPGLVRAVVDAEEGAAFAVAVDGVVAATGEAFDWDGHTEVAVMVDERYFEGSTSEITVHRLG